MCADRNNKGNYFLTSAKCKPCSCTAESPSSSTCVVSMVYKFWRAFHISTSILSSPRDHTVAICPDQAAPPLRSLQVPCFLRRPPFSLLRPSSSLSTAAPGRLDQDRESVQVRTSPATTYPIDVFLFLSGHRQGHKEKMLTVRRRI